MITQPRSGPIQDGCPSRPWPDTRGRWCVLTFPQVYHWSRTTLCICQSDHRPVDGLYIWSLAMGSHLYVQCRSVGDRDQNWIKCFWGADQGIKVTSKLLKINNQECTAAMWPLTPGNQAIKSLRKQMIKHTFCRSINLIAVANASTGNMLVTTPCLAVTGGWMKLGGHAKLSPTPSLSPHRPAIHCHFLLWQNVQTVGEGAVECSVHFSRILF